MKKSSSDEETLEKIHEILDNLSTKSFNKKENRYFSSLKRRTAHHVMSYSSQQLRTSGTDLRPRVVIHRKKEYEKPVQKNIKDVSLVTSQREKTMILPSPGLSVSDDALFEVEKPSTELEDIPEFIEVKPEQKEEIETEFKEEPLTVRVFSEEGKDESLPEWQVVEEEPEKKGQGSSVELRKKKSLFKPKQKKVTEGKEPMKPMAESEQTIDKEKEKTSNIWEPLPSEAKKREPSKTIHFKQISDEVTEKQKSGSFSEVIERNERVSASVKTKQKKSKEETNSDSSKPGFQYNGYMLYRKKIKINDKDSRTIHFFAKEPPENGEFADLPEGYEVKINRKTGVPYIRKK